MTEKIQVGRRLLRKFIVHPLVVNDGTVRCLACGQIDEDGWHDAALCPGMGGALPLTKKAQAFLAANAKSPVVYGSAQNRGGVYYRLASGESFRLTTYERRALPMPQWDLPE